MLRSRVSISVISIIIAVFSLLAPAGVAAADELLGMIPADAMFAVRINNLDSTLNSTDQFLAGASPMPMGVSMLVRAQLMNLLGSPQITGVEMGRNFAAFGVLSSGQPAPAVYILVPVTNFEEFRAGNPKVSQADANGVCTISPPQGPAILTVAAGGYALMTPQLTPDTAANLAEMAKALTESTGKFSEKLAPDQVKKAETEPLWVYANMELVSSIAGPAIFAQLENAKLKVSSRQAQQAGAISHDVYFGKIIDMYIEILKTILKETQSVSFTINPKATVLNFSETVTAVPGSGMAEMFASAPSAAENKLLGYLEDGAAMNFAGRINTPFWKKLNEKFIDAFASLSSEGASSEKAAQLKKMADDWMSSFGGAMAGAFRIEPKSKPPFVVSYAAEVTDTEKFYQSLEASAAVLSEGLIADLYSDMGFKINFTITRDAENYKDVSISSAHLTMTSTEPNSPQGQVINNLYGGGFDYKFAIVNSVCFTAIGPDPNASIHALIDTAQAGGPKETSSEIKAALELLPGAEKADFFGTFNFLRYMKMVFAMMPMPMAAPDVQSKNNMVFAGNIGDGKASFDVAIPKEHLMEIMSTVMGMQQQMMQLRQWDPNSPAIMQGAPRSMGKPQMENSAPDASGTVGVIEPTVGIDRVGFGMNVEEMKEVLGEPATTTGNLHQYMERGLAVLTTTDGKVEAFFCGAQGIFNADMESSCSYQTSKKIGVGSTQADVVAAYGEPSSTYNSSDAGGTVTMDYKDIGSKFTLKGTKVVKMVFRKP